MKPQDKYFTTYTPIVASRQPFIINQDGIIKAECYYPNTHYRIEGTVFTIYAYGTASWSTRTFISSIADVNTEGTTTAETVTYPNTNGTQGQVLTAYVSGVVNQTTPAS